MADELLPYSTPSGNVEDRRNDVPDWWWLKQKKPQPLPPEEILRQAAEEESFPYMLQYEAGLGDVGTQPPAQPQGNAPFYGPGPPRSSSFGQATFSVEPTPSENTETPFEFLSETKVRLRPAAREMAREYFPAMSEKEAERNFARYLLSQHRLREQGLIQ
jgi:hypothetical protein